jgi:hypothetical protein
MPIPEAAATFGLQHESEQQPTPVEGDKKYGFDIDLAEIRPTVWLPDCLANWPTVVAIHIARCQRVVSGGVPPKPAQQGYRAGV